MTKSITLLLGVIVLVCIGSSLGSVVVCKPISCSESHRTRAPCFQSAQVPRSEVNNATVFPSSYQGCWWINNVCKAVPAFGLECDTGKLGSCSAGITKCDKNGNLHCAQLIRSKSELCDGFDNNCNGIIDDDAIPDTAKCYTGLDGVCAIGNLQCTNGSPVCATAPGCMPVIVPKMLSVAAFIPLSISTCFIGDPCDPLTDSTCVGLRDDANTLVEAFTSDSMLAVATTDPARLLAAKEVCVDMTLTQDEINEMKAEFDLYQSNVKQWSHGDIELEIRYIEFDHVDIAEARWGIGVWVAPWDISADALPALDFLPDYVMVLPPIRDPVKQLHHDLGGCGGTFGNDFGFAGSGYSWIPKTKGSFWFECLNEAVLTHEWLHQVHYSYHQLSNFNDIYGDSFPPCGENNPDPHKWFPDTHQCLQDPDYFACGQVDCGDADVLNSHILGVHWDPNVDYVANYCRDGVQDYDETGVDVGPSCDFGSSATTFSPAVTTIRPIPPFFIPTQ